MWWTRRGAIDQARLCDLLCEEGECISGNIKPEGSEVHHIVRRTCGPTTLTE